MIRILYIFILSLLIAGLAGCTSQVKEEKKIQFVVSNWIGYSPLLYAYEKGMLDDMNIELIITNSLQSSLLMFKKNSYEGIASTQRELCIINNKSVDKDVFMPLYIFDRSYGGDAILSNIPKNKLFDEKFEYINIFLEKESINELLFEGLKKLKEWDDTQFKLHNINQYNLAQLEIKETEGTTQRKQRKKETAPSERKGNKDKEKKKEKNQTEKKRSEEKKRRENKQKKGKKRNKKKRGKRKR
eukprot:Anaeramoba_ignava/a353395_7.p1 GENE.a353395_7~~a353395_7.p1  ORF type:complete len:243 (+),score=27.16 a353395_7:238-966(+)